MTRHVDLNADLGEGCGDDAGLMQIITSCNIACGGHAGTVETMRTALHLAKSNGVAVGAHPAFPDPENFGRKPLPLKGEALQTSLMQQISALTELAETYGVTVRHVKPHGALYNMAAKDAGLAADIVTAMSSTLPNAHLVGPPTSALEKAAHGSGTRFVTEGFADRAYETDGSLRSRALPGAVFDTVAAQVEQARRFVMAGEVVTLEGKCLQQSIDTLCVHGDTPGALAAARAIRVALETEGAMLCAPN